MSAATKRLSEVLGPLGGGHLIGLFRLMAIAEEEISSAKLRAPSSSSAFDESFRLLFPTDLLRGKAEEVYRSHCRELLVRAEEGKRFGDPTDAELLCACLESSLKAPLSSSGGALVEQLFAKVFPESALASAARLYREPYPGAIEEELVALRRRFQVSR